MHRIADYRRDCALLKSYSILTGRKLAIAHLIRNAKRTGLNVLIDDDRGAGIERASELRKRSAASCLIQCAKERLCLAVVHIGFVNESLSSIVRRKINRLAIRSPSQTPRAPIRVRR